MIYRGPDILIVVWFGSYPTPPPSPVSKLDGRHIGRRKKRDSLLTEEEWREEEEPNHTTAR